MRRWPANLMTSGNLFCGFLSVLLAMENHPQLAAWLIVFAAVLDAFDGKAARFFGGGGSEFGLQFDSLADMISFGFAPAALIYTVAFSNLSLAGLVVTFIPVLAAAIRLARFNVTADGKPHDFIGLSSPLHACLVATFVAMSYATWGQILDTNILAGLVILTSLLMVSRLPLPGLPRFTLKEPGYNLVKMLVLMTAVAFMCINPPRYTFPALAGVVAMSLITGVLRAMFVREVTEDEVDEELDDENSEPVTVRGNR
jgi:CDP-diacylglycerol---serine O-phosphatidyltransferase